MKSISLVVCVAAAIAGCSVNGGTPQTAWGKKDVSLLDYRTDAGQCAVLAASSDPQSNGGRAAGGVNGENGAPPPQPQASGSASAGGAGPGGVAGSSGSNAPSLGGGTYSGTASADYAQRAAMQQRSAEMAAQRARSDALKSCLVQRGYTEFSLTAEQRAELDKLPQGSEERRAYLYKLGTSPDVLSKQAVAKPGS